MKFTTARITAVVAVTGVVLFGATTATAGGSPAIPDGSVWQSDIAKPANDAYLKTYDNTVGKPQLKADVANDLELGRGKVVQTIKPTLIPRIGGSFIDDRMNLGGFALPPGTWQIASDATFTRTIAAPRDTPTTRPLLALRYGRADSTNPSGISAGTIAGVDISPAKGGVLTGSAYQTVTTTAPTTVVAVYAFGYNDDGSFFASEQITVAAQITATRIG